MGEGCGIIGRKSEGDREVLTLILVFIAGFLQAGMQSFNGLLRGHVGMLGTTLATHVVGGALLILYILLVRREKMKLGPMPWYLYSAGFMGLCEVAGSCLCVAKIGVAMTTCFSIGGELALSILVDHFGWMGMRKTPFEARRFPGLLVVLAGLTVVNFGGLAAGPERGGGPLYILLAVLLGGANVFNKAVNFKATKELGPYNGTLVNYVVASLLGAVLLALLDRGHAQVSAFAAAPEWLYLGGVFGVVALVVIVISLNKIDLFQSAVLLLLGHLAGAALLDTVLFHSMSWARLLGAAIVAAGVVWDKKASIKRENKISPQGDTP